MAEFQKFLNDLPSDATVRDAALAALASRATALADVLVPAAEEAEADVEHVHRLRVSSRRTAAVLRVFAGMWPQKRVGKLRRAVTKIRQAAGDARDLDVLCAELSERRAPLTLAKLRAKRAALQPKLQKLAKRYDGGEGITTLADSLAEKLRKEQRVAELDVKLVEWAPKRLARMAKPFLKATPSSDDPMTAWHEYRILGKRVRYAIELLAPGLPESVRTEVYPQFERLQELLGGINDLASAGEHLLALKRRKDEALCREIEVISEVFRSRLEIECERFREWLASDAPAKLRGALVGKPLAA